MTCVDEHAVAATRTAMSTGRNPCIIGVCLAIDICLQAAQECFSFQKAAAVLLAVIIGKVSHIAKG